MNFLLNSRLYKKLFGVRNLQHIIIFPENNFKTSELEVDTCVILERKLHEGAIFVDFTDMFQVFRIVPLT